MTWIFEKYRLVVLITIISLGFILRIYYLGNLGLIENEDYVVISANSILQNYIPLFPSGIVYPRAIPYSYIVAIFIKLFGFNEFVLRLPSVIFSTCSIGIVYLLGKKIVGWETGILAAFAMSVSDWEIFIGRTARMYSMFSFFFLLSVYLIFSIVIENKKGFKALSLISSSITCLIHPIGGMLAFVYSTFAYFFRDDKTKRAIIMINILFILFSFTLDKLYSKYNYEKKNLLIEQSIDEEALKNDKSNTNSIGNIVKQKYLRIFIKLKNDYREFYIFITLLLVFAIAGSLFAYSRLKLERLFVICLIMIFLTLYIQQITLSIYILFAYLILGKTYNTENYFKRFWFLLFTILSTTIGWVLFDLLTSQNSTDAQLIINALMKSIKTLFSYPPNFTRFYIGKYPLMSVIAFLSGLIIFLKYMLNRKLMREHYLPILFIVPVIAMGFHPNAINRFYERYASFLNPYFLLLFSYGMMWCILKIWAYFYKINCRKVFRLISVFLLIAFIFMSTDGFNLKKAFAILNMNYGVNMNIEKTDMGDFFFYPDHQGPSLYVKDHFREGDIIISMDILAHYSYFPKAHYQLTVGYRGDAEGFIGASTIRTAAQLQDVLSLHSKNRTWIILSGQKLREHKDKPEMKNISSFLITLAPQRVYTGRDGLSDVYLIIPGTLSPSIKWIR